MSRFAFLPHFPPLARVLIPAWALGMILQPIVLWTWGQQALVTGMSLMVLFQAVTVMIVLAGGWGWPRALSAFGVVAALSFFAEWLGSTTGLPFGKYHYTEILQPQLLGVPLLIPLAWMMMLPPAWAVTEIILRGKKTNPLAFALVSALAFTAWDLFLDPQMVGWGFWVWEIPGQYFGIPSINYFGWVLVSGLLTFLIRPTGLPSIPLLAIYIITCLLQTIGQGVFWGQPGPALFGFFGMGIFIFLAMRNLFTTQGKQ
jgi:putative membrane protein